MNMEIKTETTPAFVKAWVESAEGRILYIQEEERCDFGRDEQEERLIAQCRGYIHGVERMQR